MSSLHVANPSSYSEQNTLCSGTSLENTKVGLVIFHGRPSVLMDDCVNIL